MYQNKKISLILPCFNEEQGLNAMLPNIPVLLDEVIVVDNNSSDKSAMVARSFKRVMLVQEKNQGYGRAYKTGFQAAAGDIIITMDSDNTYPLDQVGNLLDTFFKYKLDFLSACRFPLKNQAAMPLINWLGNFVLTFVFNVLTGHRVKDSQSGMWIFKRSLLSQMRLVSDGMSFSEEIKMEAILNQTIRFAEKHIKYSERIGSVKLKKFKDGLENLFFLFQKRLKIMSR